MRGYERLEVGGVVEGQGGEWRCVSVASNIKYG